MANRYSLHYITQVSYVHSTPGYTVHATNYMYGLYVHPPYMPVKYITCRSNFSGTYLAATCEIDIAVGCVMTQRWTKAPPTFPYRMREVWTIFSDW